jgi:hypothetical protein
MAQRWSDEDRYDYRAGSYEGDFGYERGAPERSTERGLDRDRSFGERGYRDWGRGYERDYGSDRGRYGGFQGRGLGTYSPRSDYDRGPFPYSADYGDGPRYGGGFERERGGYERPYGLGREYERDYARTPSAARDFRGLGPKGYTRSDERIHDDICDRLMDDPAIDASDVEVKVADGEVTLTGTVDGRDEKRRAEDSAEFVTGVRNVQNMLRVELRAGAPGMAVEIGGGPTAAEPAARGGAAATGAAGAAQAATRRSTPQQV